MRLGYLEFLPNFDTKDRRDPEIVCHFECASGPSKYTVLWFKENREDYSIESVGDRVLNPDVPQDILWELIRYGFTVLNARKRLLERTHSLTQEYKCQDYHRR